jgi:hypothetical protein
VPIVAIGSAAFALVSLLGASRPQLAKAAVLRAATAALGANGRILYVEGTVHQTGVFCLGEEVPSRCIRPTTATSETSLSPKPGKDPVAYTYRQWLGSSMDEQHVIYETGDETAIRGPTRETYDPSDNTITSSHATLGGAARAVRGKGGIPETQALTLADLEELYSRARYSSRGRSGSPRIRLAGEAMIDGKTAYELEITNHERLGSDTIETTLAIYLNAHSFLPMRAVTSGTTPVSRARTIRCVETFSARLLAATPSNAALLRLRAHEGERRVSLAHAERSIARPMFVAP